MHISSTMFGISVTDRDRFYTKSELEERMRAAKEGRPVQYPAPPRRPPTATVTSGEVPEAAQEVVVVAEEESDAGRGRSRDRGSKRRKRARSTSSTRPDDRRMVPANKARYGRTPSSKYTFKS